jgi:hypothetical protein
MSSICSPKRPSHDPEEEADRGRAAAGSDQQGSAPKEAEGTKGVAHIVSQVVGSAPARSMPRSNIRSAGGRSVRKSVRFPTVGEQESERQRLFKIIEQLVLWDNTDNEDLISAVRKEILDSWQATCESASEDECVKAFYDPLNMPPVCDPFAGSGSIPISAQWMRLRAIGRDLNPVAVLINKTMVEIPPIFKEWRQSTLAQVAIRNSCNASGEVQPAWRRIHCTTLNGCAKRPTTESADTIERRKLMPPSRPHAQTLRHLWGGR